MTIIICISLKLLQRLICAGTVVSGTAYRLLYWRRCAVLAFHIVTTMTVSCAFARFKMSQNTKCTRCVSQAQNAVKLVFGRGSAGSGLPLVSLSAGDGLTLPFLYPSTHSASRLAVTARLSLQIKHCSPLLPGLHFAADDSRSICRVYQSSLYFPMVSWTINILGLGLAYILLSSSSAAAAVATVVTWSSACQ